jgi:hypothetical protein
MMRRLLGIFLGILLGTPFVLAAQKAEPVITDPRLGVINLEHANERVEFDLVNNGSAPIVFWTAVLVPGPKARPTPLTTIGGSGPDAAWITGGHDLIEPGGQHHVVASGGLRDPVPRGANKLYAVAAVFADGTWAGNWGALEGNVKGLTIRRLVVEQWLSSLRALLTDPDPVGKVVELLRQLEHLPGYRFGISPPTFPGAPPAPPLPPSEEAMRQNIDHFARVNLRFFVQRLYDKMLMLDRRGAEPKKWRDERAEKQLKSRADAKQQLANRIAEEIAMLELELEVTAWVTMLGPNGERIGPAVPPPPPTAASMARWKQSMATRRLPPEDLGAPPQLKTPPAR